MGPLISPETLAADPASFHLLDARPGAEAFASGHLRGAIHADLNRCLSTASDPGFDPAQGGRHPLPSLQAWGIRLGHLGIGPDTAVVAYDDASGGNGACRLWWMLRAVGHRRVAVLDGGLAAARQAGLEITTDPSPAPSPRSPYPCPVWQRPWLDLASFEAWREDPSRNVLDVRSRERWLGETEPIDPVAGRIPGTWNLPYTQNLGPDGRYQSPEALRPLYLDLLDGTSPERLAVHCGSGVTACHTLLALEHAGLPGAVLYVGSFSEWCRNDKPLGRG